MRHLSTSLPPTTRRRLPDQQQPDLLADFKAAALSVTNLYKTAAAAQDKARAAGYQDAVEDLLAFLDQENLGLMDGEGWRVRQWATERLVDDGGLRQQGGSDPGEGEEEREQETERAGSRSSSPEVGRKVPPMQADSSELQEGSAPLRRNATSEPPTQPVVLQQPPALDNFTFNSSHSYPTNHDREGSMDVDTATAPTTPSTTTSSNFPDSGSTRPALRHGRGSKLNSNARRTTAVSHGSNNQIATINFNLGAGAGSKRKVPYSDFFDISGINFEGQGGGKDQGSGGGRGGKRSRHA